MPPAQRASRTWQAVYGITVLLVVALFFWSLQALLNPFLLFLLLAGLLTPFAGHRAHSLLLLLTGGLTLMWLLQTTGFLLAPFFLSLVFAYVLHPLVVRVEGPRVPRGVAIALLVLPIVGGVVLALVLGVPALTQQVARFVESLPGLIGTMLTVLSYVFLTPILTFYLLRDWEGILARLESLAPHARREGVVSFAREYDHLLARYLRGQMVAAAAVGVMTGLGFWLVGFPFALMLGVVAGVFNLVPYLGLVVSLVPALVIALFSGAVLASLLKIALVFGVVQLLDSSVIGPRIVGQSVGLHPVWVILALAVAGFFFGFVGLLLAIPLAVFVKLLLEALLARYRRSALYLGSRV